MTNFKILPFGPLLLMVLVVSFSSCGEDDEKRGCTNPNAANYDQSATTDDGSCIIYGCLDTAALNFNSSATADDGSCLYDTTSGQFTIDFKALVNGAPLVMKDSIYRNVLGYFYKLETIRFYVSNLYLIRDDNTEVLANEVSYLDLENSHRTYSTDGEKISAAVPSGDYKGVKFAIGVDPSVNNADPSVYPSDHPLSIFRNAHWTWNSGYIFLKLEGKMDTVPDGNKSLTRLFVYHCGNNQLFRELVFMKDFSIAVGSTYEFEMTLNADKIFYSTSDTLDVRNESVTHSEPALFPLAERVINLFADAIEPR